MPLKIGVDIGGVISKYPALFKGLIDHLARSGAEVHAVTDMTLDKARAMIVNNLIPIDFARVHAADYKLRGERCKAELCRSLGIDVLIDDHLAYLSVPGSPRLRLYVMPDVDLPYYQWDWRDENNQTPQRSGNPPESKGMPGRKTPPPRETVEQATLGVQTGHVYGESLTALFHRLWSKAVGTEGYNKEEWKQLENTLLAAGVLHSPPAIDPRD